MCSMIICFKQDRPFKHKIQSQTVYNIQNMHFIESTPSVNFALEDYTTNSTRNNQDIHLDHALFQLSNTNNKNTISPHNVPNVSQLDINKKELLENTPTVLRIDTEDFFEQFSSKFTVKFQSSQSMKQKLNTLRGHIENQQMQQMSIENSIQDFKDVRLSFPIDKNKQNYFGISINNQKGLKSEIISFKKKGCFGKQNIKINEIKEICEFQINSAVIKLKKMPPQIYQPKSCRNISANLYFTSKATPIDAKCAKKVIQKHNKLQGNMKKKQKSVNFPQIVKHKIKNESTQTNKSEQFSLIKRNNIFVKLPNLK